MRARVKDEGTGLGGLVRRLFAERQLLLRSGDRVLFVPFSRRLQIGLCVALLAAAGWTGFATVAFLRHEARVPALHQRIAADGLAYRGLLAQVAGFQRKFDSIADALDRDHDLMLGLVAQNASLRQGVVALGGRLGSSEKELDQAAAARRAVDADVATMESNLRELTERNGMLRRRLARVQDALRTAMAERDRHQARGTQLARDVAALKEETEGLENARRDAGRRLARVQDALGTAMAERDRHQARGTQLARDVAALKGEIEGLENARRDAGRRLADRTLAYMETVESVDRDLRQAVQARDDAVLEAARKAERAEALEGQVSRLQDLVAETEDALEVRTLAHGDDMELARADLRSVEGERNEALAIASRLEGRVRELEVRLSDLKRSRRLAEGALSDRTVAHAVNVHALRAELDKAVAERDRVLRISTRLTDRVKALEGRVDDFHGEKLAAELRLSERTDAYEAVLETARSDLRSALEARSRATVASGHRQRRIEELEQRLVVLTTSKAFANRRFQDQSLAYQEDIETLRGRLEEVVEERDAARRSRDSLGEMVGVLETRLTHLQQSQEEAVQRLTARAVASIGELERLVALTRTRTGRLAGLRGRPLPEPGRSLRRHRARRPAGGPPPGRPHGPRPAPGALGRPAVRASASARDATPGGLLRHQ